MYNAIVKVCNTFVQINFTGYQNRYNFSFRVKHCTDSTFQIKNSYLYCRGQSRTILMSNFSKILYFNWMYISVLASVVNKTTLTREELLRDQCTWLLCGCSYSVRIISCLPKSIWDFSSISGICLPMYSYGCEHFGIVCLASLYTLTEHCPATIKCKVKLFALRPVNQHEEWLGSNRTLRRTLVGNIPYLKLKLLL